MLFEEVTKNVLETRQLRQLAPTSAMYACARTITSTLLPVYAHIRRLQRCNCNVAESISKLVDIIKHLRTVERDSKLPTDQKSFAKRLVTELQAQLDNHVKGNSLSHMALFLDPRFKNLQCMFDIYSSEDVASTHNRFIVNELIPILKRVNRALFPNLTIETAVPENASLLLRFSGSSNGVNFIDSEISAYTTLPEDNNRSPIWWWHSATQFPRLAVVARCVLAIPGSHVECDKAFSSVGCVKSKSEFSVDSLNKLVTVARNTDMTELKYGTKDDFEIEPDSDLEYDEDDSIDDSIQELLNQESQIATVVESASEHK